MVWAWVLCEQLEHGRGYYGLGMDAFGMVTQACSRSRQPEEARALKRTIPTIHIDIYIYIYILYIYRHNRKWANGLIDH